MLQLFRTYVEVFYLDFAYVALAIHVCWKCMFQMCYAISNAYYKCFICMLHILQCPYIYVANVCCKCFICFGRMLQQILYVASVPWAGTARGTGEGGTLGRNGPRVRVASEVSVAAGQEHKAVSMGVAAGTKYEAASISRQQARSTRRSGARSCIYRHLVRVSLLKMGRQQTRSTRRSGAWSCIHRRPLRISLLKTDRQ
jgi:hypothetical protein